MALPVIALSRQRGTGGDVIAALVAHELGLPLYDRQVLAQAAAKAGVSPDTIAAGSAGQGCSTACCSGWASRRPPPTTVARSPPCCRHWRLPARRSSSATRPGR